MKTVGYDKWLDIKVVWDGNRKFDVLYERNPSEWIVIDTFLSSDVIDTAKANNIANNYIRKVEKEMAAA